MTHNNFLKLCWRGARAGVAYGLVISLAACYYYGVPYTPAPPRFVSHFHNSRDAVAAAAGLWALIGILFQAARTVFARDDWSRRQRTIVHYVVTLLGLTLVSYWAGWYQFTFPNVLLFWGIFLIVYTAGWLIYQQRTKRDIAALNDALAKHDQP